MYAIRALQKHLGKAPSYFDTFLNGRGSRSARPQQIRSTGPKWFRDEKPKQKEGKRARPGAKDVIQAAARTSMVSAGITKADISRILRSPKLSMRTREKMLNAQTKLASYVSRINYGQRLSYKKFTIGMKLKGRVISIRTHGIFIDIGAIGDAFCHLGDISKTIYVRDARDVLQLGQDVHVFVKHIDHQREQVIVSLLPVYTGDVSGSGARLPVSAFNISQPMTGIVNKVNDGGAYIDIGAVVDAHLPMGFHRDRHEYPNLLMCDYLEVGMNLTVWIATVDVAKNRIQVSTEPDRIADLYLPMAKEQLQRASEAARSRDDMEEDADEFYDEFDEYEDEDEDDDDDEGDSGAGGIVRYEYGKHGAYRVKRNASNNDNANKRISKPAAAAARPEAMAAALLPKILAERARKERTMKDTDRLTIQHSKHSTQQRHSKRKGNK